MGDSARHTATEAGPSAQGPALGEPRVEWGQHRPLGPIYLRSGVTLDQGEAVAVLGYTSLSSTRRREKNSMSNLKIGVSFPEGILFRELDGEAVVLETVKGVYFGLDSTATRIWTLLDRHRQLEEVHTALVAEFDASEEELRGDLVRFVGELAAHGLLEIHGQ
jgi:Coenzyme PQQ synthesis protein D (PqqD)